MAGTEATTSVSDGTMGKKTFKDRITETLPPWFISALHDKRKWKTYFRCLVATFATFVLLLCQTSLDVLGQAAFFGLICSAILPPNMALSLFFFATLTMVFGMLVGWAWGAAAMAAAMRARSQVLLAQQVQTAEAGYNTNANIDAQYQASIFAGAFLDPRSSAVYGVFFFIGCYALGYLRASRPKLTIGAIFGTIILDLMSSFGPLFPIQEYTLARQLLIPALVYIAIGLACTILLFPQSLHSIVLDGLIKTDLGPVLSLLKLQEDILATNPDNHDRWTELATAAYGHRKAHAGGVAALDGQVGLLQLEVTRGRMGPKDLARVYEKSKEVGARAYGLASFVIILEERHQSSKAHAASPIPHPTVRAKTAFDELEKPQQPGRNLHELMPILAESTSTLRTTATKALDDVVKYLDELNHTRWRKFPAPSPILADREANLKSLKEAVATFRESKHFEMLQPFQSSFDQTTGQLIPSHRHAYQLSLRGLFRCYVMTANLIAFSLALIEFLELLLEIERANPVAKFQFPTAFTKMLTKAANDSDGMGNPLDMGAEMDSDSANSSSETLVGETPNDKTKVKKVYAKDPDAGDPTNGFQRFGRVLSKAWKALSSPQGIFALKYGIVSIALWIPQVCPSSAYFIYTNRGLWALIMAQTGLGVFTGEQIGAFIARMSGTVVGLVLGMLAWYIGAGKGNGSPYGVAAATMVIFAPFLYVRTVAPLQAMVFWMMTGVTITFVVGYSWVDGHVYQTANQGIGAPLAGRRALLVIIGFTAAFLVMLFPKPISAKLLVRRSFARNIADLGDLYGKEVTGFELELDVSERETEKVLDIKERQEKYRAQFFKIFGRLQMMQQQMAFAEREPGLRGPWPAAKYRELMTIQTQILSASAILSGAYARLQPGWCKILAEKSDLMHPAFIADCLALFELLHHALRNASPLPPTMPIFERLAYHRLNTNRLLPNSVRSPPAAKALDGEGGDDDGAEDPQNELGINAVNGVLTWANCRNEQMAVFATATVALAHIANGLNDLHRTVLGLVGEKELEGFDRAQEIWARGDLNV